MALRHVPLADLLLLAGCENEPPAARGQEIVLCYATLADAVCRTTPDPGREAQLLGVWLRPVDDPAGKAFWLALAERRAAAVAELAGERLSQNEASPPRRTRQPNRSKP